MIDQVDDGGTIFTVLAKFFRFSTRFTLMAVLFIAGALLVSARLTENFSSTRLFRQDAAPSSPVAIVFGAGLTRDGSPTPVLRDRVQTAVDLYLSGKVEKLLVSGDNRTIHYNEPEAMYTYAVEHGVDPDDVIRDYAGLSTYDTCYRARHIFGVRDALIVTQLYHLPRAVYTCNALGLDADGVIADQRKYTRRSQVIWNTREALATLAAWWDVWVSRPLPILGKPEPIFKSEAPAPFSSQ